MSVEISVDRINGNYQVKYKSLCFSKQNYDALVRYQGHDEAWFKNAIDNCTTESKRSQTIKSKSQEYFKLKIDRNIFITWVVAGNRSREQEY